MARTTRPPGLTEERTWWAEGHEFVVGVDEVGRGAWAGPLTVGAVVLPTSGRVNGIRDSKQLAPAQRERVLERIQSWAVSTAVGHASADECDRLGMSAAQKLAAQRAIDGLSVRPTVALVDGPWDFVGLPNTTTLVKGDARSVSIAAASIVAKVTRDQIMRDLSPHFPWYSFHTNKGYPCPKHQRGLHGYGPCSVHRRTWVFVEDLAWRGVRRRPGINEPVPLFD